MSSSKSQKHWSRVRLIDEASDLLSVMLALRKLKHKDAYIIIHEALKLHPDYDAAMAAWRAFNHADDPPPE